MRLPPKLVLLGLFSLLNALAAPEPPAQPWRTSTYGLETGVLWEVGTGTPFGYRFLQTQISWRSPEFWERSLADSSHVVLRHRLTLLGAAVEGGPEARYFGVTASPSLEWWNRTATWSLFTGAGGGVGVIDSRGIRGGQGQDFTLNWFARGGCEHAVSRHVRLSATLLFQHLSNGGQTKPNPGINALGFMLGCVWSR